MSNLAEKISPSHFEALPVGALLLASNGAVIDANAAAHVLLGAAPGALAGRSAALLFPELWSGSARHSEEFRDTDPPRRVQARRLDGGEIALRLRFASFAADRFLVTLEDIADFEREIAERSAEVVAANREFEKFIDIAAHDLRAPLRILTGFADALEDECAAVLNEDGTTFLREIRTAGSRMEGIIDGLLAIARSGRAEMACESLDLTTLVELVCYELRHSDSTREVDWQIAPDLNAWGDVRLMMTALRALLGNAWKFTGRTGNAQVRFHAEQREGVTWFCVTDNGAGFDMAHAGRLFKPFTRLHRQDEFPGHGMGLATAQVIVRRHGGQIDAESVPGSGTTVRFTLAPRPE
ncbi:MAG TPA: ATP-binding protein [Steroidobacteraceae bacterium]|nr:ATP-binding protein [Steroidobacteraceae bacterium]